MTPSRTQVASSSRLSVEDWTERALALLMDEGVGEIKVSRLCRELGVTKGSFYWHFSDLDALLRAIAERWCAETRTTLSGLEQLGDLPPLERIRAMSLRLTDRRWSVERALREWGQGDPMVAAVIAESDQLVFDLTQAALLELGHDADGARLRAGLLVYAGVGFAHGQGSLPQPTEADIENLVRFLAGEAAR
jgi:AcrR family transcriptional regulator